MTVSPLRIRWLAVVPVLAIAVVLSACSDDPAPTPEPTATPTTTPTATSVPTDTPTAEPTAAPTATPTDTPTAEPTAAPTAIPTSTPAPTPTDTPAPTADDRTALVALYEATDGANWDNNANWLSDRPIGEWYGVIADLSGRVTELSLNFNQLSGEIPAELGNLANLELLELEGNRLTGEIPAELGNLANLRYLDLWQNQLSGEIPAELGNLANLRGLLLGRNQLSGEIPADLGNLTNLEALFLEDNRLSGEIPAALGSLASLTNLDLADNQLNGCVPGRLRDQLYMNVSDLGGLPFCDAAAEPAPTARPATPATDERAALVALYEATDGANWTSNDNWLSDRPIGEWYGVTTDRNGRVTELLLGDNRLSGEIPAELGSLVNLVVLELSGNRLSGEIPGELGSLANLQYLSLNYNRLSGEIPAELGNLSNLGWLDLSWNQLSGEIPAELGNLTNLESLFLYVNQLRGEIPAELGSLANVVWLSLGDNQLSGEIPEELGNLASLELLALQDNQLSGCIPGSLRGQLDMDYSDLGGLLFCGATPEPAPTDRPAEPAVDDHANAVDDATAVTLWEAVKGSLDYEDDVDIFTFQAEKGQSYRIDVALGNLSDSEVALLDANEELLASNDDHGDSLASRIDWVAPSSGEYYVAVSGWSGTGSYTLTVSVPAVPAATPTPLPTAAPTPDADDRTALVALYEATDGANWTSNDNWLSDRPIGEWYGVTTDRNGRVTELLLSENQLSGEIPTELGNLTNLEWLGLGRNRLSGEIPGELGGLVNLQELSLSENQLSGEIPAELGGLVNLQELFLSENQLSGEIPAELGNLPNLQELYLSGNRLTRCLPEGLREIQESDLSIMSIRPPLCGTTPASMIAAGGTIVVLQSLESLSDAHRRAGTEFEWSQVSGPPVELLDGNAEYARFTAPVVVEDTRAYSSSRPFRTAQTTSSCLVSILSLSWMP